MHAVKDTHNNNNNNKHKLGTLYHVRPDPLMSADEYSIIILTSYHHIT